MTPHKQSPQSPRHRWCVALLLALFLAPHAWAQAAIDVERAGNPRISPAFSPRTRTLSLGATGGAWARALTSPKAPPATRSSRHLQGFGTLRQAQLIANADLLTAAMIVLIPTVAIELTLFIGNLAAFSTNARLLAWGIQGMAFSLLGGAITLPWIILGIQEGIAVSFIALHLALLGISIANIVLGLQARQRKQKVAILPWGYVSPQGVAQGGIACTGTF